MIILDTGPIVVAANRNDTHHERCAALLLDVEPPRLVPGPVIAEVCYLLARDAGTAVEAAFLRSFDERFLRPVDLTSGDLARAAELVEQYADLPLGGTDACVVALAERLNVAEVATIDRRDFSVVRPRHVPALTLLPE